jgi:hypothetical protein
MAGTKSRVLSKSLKCDADGYIHQADANDAAPADADLDASSFVLWYDDTNDAIMVKAKAADGTVVTGTVSALS